MAEQGLTFQDRAGQDKTRQTRTKDKAELVRAITTRQDKKIGQGKIKQDWAG